MLGFGHSFIPCALGRAGTAPFHSEGDGTTPLGCWPLRFVFFRPDRLPRPVSGLPVFPLAPGDGWCDAPDDACYNRAVKLPFRSSAESLWCEDAIYDIILVPGINDNPPITGRGSALFIHIAREGFLPTQGCIAMKRRNFLHILPRLGPASRLIISSASLKPASAEIRPLSQTSLDCSTAPEAQKCPETALSHPLPRWRHKGDGKARYGKLRENKSSNRQ